MTQEEKQLLLKDLCARLPYGIICKSKLYRNILFNSSHISLIESEEIKPYLRPLSSMTEEEAKDIVTLIGIKDIISVNITEKYINVIKDDGFCSTETITIWFNEIVSSIEIFDYLNVHHFDYRDLIEKELAIEAPEKMYKI